jgi:hypothetical protein
MRWSGMAFTTLSEPTMLLSSMFFDGAVIY